VAIQENSRKKEKRRVVLGQGKETSKRINEQTKQLTGQIKTQRNLTWHTTHATHTAHAGHHL
jgi:hypothetical protein